MQGHSSSMVSTGCWLFCIIQPGLGANFSRESLQPSHLGRRWVVQHPQLTLWDRVRGMQHSLKAGSHLGEGGLCGQGVRLECSNEHTRAHPSVVAKGMSASHPHQPSSPPRTTPIFPRRPIVVNAVPYKQACQMLRCQLPKARGRLPTGQLPQLKQVYPSASTLRLRG